MLQKKYRFHSRGGIRYTYQKGKTLRTPSLSLVFAPNTHHHQRFAVVVSKKVLKSAVDRNRVRRRLFEAIRLELPNFKHHQDSIFVVFHPDIIKMPFTEVQRLIHQLLLESINK